MISYIIFQIPSFFLCLILQNDMNSYQKKILLNSLDSKMIPTFPDLKIQSQVAKLQESIGRNFKFIVSNITN